MKTYIVTTDCQLGHLLTNYSLAEIAIQLEQGGHKVKCVELLNEGAETFTPHFKWLKTEEPPVPQWLYTLSVGGVAGEQRLTAGSFREAAQRWNCKVNYAAPFVAQCTTSDGKRAVISWNLDPVG